MDLELAGLATGPVDRVWYSPAGDQLSIRSSSGKIFETNDFDRWTAAPADTAVPPVPEGRSINSSREWRAGSQSGGSESAGVCFRPVRVPLRQQRQELGESDGVPRAVDCRGQPPRSGCLTRPMRTKSWWPDRPESFVPWTAAGPGAVSTRAFRIFPRPASEAFPKVRRAPKSSCPARWWWNGSRANVKPGGPHNNAEAASELSYRQILSDDPRRRRHRARHRSNRTFIPAWRTAASSSPPIAESTGSPKRASARAEPSPPSGWIPPIRASLLRCSPRSRAESAARAPHHRRRPVLGRYFRESSRRRRSRRHRGSRRQRDLRRHRSGRLLCPDESQRLERRASFLDRAGRACRRYAATDVKLDSERDSAVGGSRRLRTVPSHGAAPRGRSPADHFRRSDRAGGRSRDLVQRRRRSREFRECRRTSGSGAVRDRYRVADSNPV